MDTTERVTVSEQSKETQAGAKNEYGIFEYFQDHTGLAVTCVSAIVAVTSFVFKYALVLQNATYMRYWKIHTAYMAGADGIQFYTVFAAFVYSIMIVLVHSLLSKTADVYRHDNKLVTRGKYVIKNLRRHYKKATKEKRKIDKQLKTSISAEEKICLQERLANINKDIELHQMNDPETRSAIRGVKVRTVCNVLLSVIVAFLICALGIVIFGITVFEQLRIEQVVMASLPVILIDLLLYFVPAYFATRPKKVKDTDIVDMAYEVIEGRTPMFPVEKFVRKGAKTIVSNGNIKMMIVQYLATIIVCLFMFSQLGITSAKAAKEFPIYVDENGTYAVVYNNGDVLVLKEANIEGKQIEIDVTQQKVVSAADASYEICTFETVIVTGKDGG